MMFPLTYPEIALIFFLIFTLRYYFMTGIYYVLVYKLFDKYLSNFKINSKVPSGKTMQKERFWAVVNNLNFAWIGALSFYFYEKGWLKVYLDINEYGLLYFVLIIPVLLVLHDAYFFWTHYLMHRSKIKKYTGHHIHHQFHNVSPWSAFSVHPIEGFIEIIFRPLILFFIPLHPITLLIFAFISFTLNIIGHSGYEFFPSGYSTHPLTKMKSSASFHYLHHKNPNYNFSLFLNFWDRVMGTLHPDYEEVFEKTAHKNPFKMPEENFLRSLVVRLFTRKERRTKVEYSEVLDEI